jgi:hypothetical protein
LWTSEERRGAIFQQALADHVVGRPSNCVIASWRLRRVPTGRGRARVDGIVDGDDHEQVAARYWCLMEMLS